MMRESSLRKEMSMNIRAHHKDIPEQFLKTASIDTLFCYMHPVARERLKVKIGYKSQTSDWVNDNL